MPGQKAPEAARREQIVTAAYQVAWRHGIDGITIRAVAAQATLSHGLVLFHFKRKDQLVAALLDRVLATTILVGIADDDADDGAEATRTPVPLRALLEQEMARVAQEPRGMRLFFEYWALGTRDPMIRTKVSAALGRYREAFRVVAEASLGDGAAHPPGVTADGVAAVAVSLINGGAVQAMIDPGQFDVAAYLAAGHGLLERLTTVDGTATAESGAISAPSPI